MYDCSSDIRTWRPLVFVGPTLAAADARRTLPDAVVLPPIRRDELYDARERGAQVILIVDGLFAHHLAVSPREVVDVVRDGATVVGASSLGALRAAECWPAGMVGVGLVYRMFRAGALESDDEVAVSVVPERGYAANSVALINVRYALARARRAGMITRTAETDLVTRCQAMRFATRDWDALLADCDRDEQIVRLKTFCRPIDLKREDARRALSYVRSRLNRGETRPPVRARVVGPSMKPPMRYPGHDPLLGYSEAALNGAFVEWLFGSGRYRRYVPLSKPRGAGETLCRQLEAVGELEAERVRWHAVEKLAAAADFLGLRPSHDVVAYVRERVAVAHGFASWHRLVAQVDDERVTRVVKFSWVQRACAQVALALAARDRV